MSTLYLWEKIVMGIIAIASFAAGYTSGHVVDGVMALTINTLIIYVIFRAGNKFFKRKENLPTPKL